MDNKNIKIDELFYTPEGNTLESFLDGLVSTSAASENDETFNINLDTTIDDTITQLEKALKLEALTEDEWEDLHDTDDHLQDDISMLDFE